MNSDNSALKSQKTGSSSTPYDQIIQQEQKEAERATQEIEAIHQSQETVENGLIKTHNEDLEAIKEAGREELVEYQNNDLKPLLEEGKVNAKNGSEELEKAFGSKKDQAVTKLVDYVTNPESLAL